MDLNHIWDLFIDSLSQQNEISNCHYKKITGIPFLYIKVTQDIGKHEIEKNIQMSAAKVMKGKQLHCETSFVRSDKSLYVYQHRFLVPQKKMFCCGNLCKDCIRLRPFD